MFTPEQLYYLNQVIVFIRQLLDTVRTLGMYLNLVDSKIS